MLGGVGWTRAKIEDFLKRKVYVVPGGAVPKDGDKNGRIIHNYSYPHKKIAIRKFRINQHIR